LSGGRTATERTRRPGRNEGSGRVDFELSRDQGAIRDMVRDFARNEIAPNALEWDENQHFPRELFAKLGELGML
jgi:hypothetical protein